MDNDPVYLDANASLPLTREAREAMLAAMEGWLGNPSSPHAAGRRARSLLDEARTAIRQLCGRPEARVILTASASEANQLALVSLTRTCQSPGRIIFSAGEHPSVRQAVNFLAGHGWETREIPLDAEGRVDVETFRAACLPGAVAAVQWANAELGSINPVERLATIARRRGVRLHLDTVQAAGKLSLAAAAIADVSLSLSAHKIGGPQGIGALVWPRDWPTHPLGPGGSQEGGLRAGTEAVLLAAGFAAAARRAVQTLDEWRTVRGWRDELAQALEAELPDARINGPRDGSDTGNCLSLTLPGEDASLLALALDLEGVMVSRGPACLSGAAEASPTLRAIGLSAADARATLRISLWPGNRPEDFTRLREKLAVLTRKQD